MLIDFDRDKSIDYFVDFETDISSARRAALMYTDYFSFGRCTPDIPLAPVIASDSEKMELSLCCCFRSTEKSFRPHAAGWVSVLTELYI
ncbi:hypothetical protein Q8A67_003188 [Cirrhinus molitorella]|uniref:Uncharacterized protein n=1 Tax=Cirrhinus molitorella TaxID=172907 RepID=A0AA88TUZ0_9TELE|nr:hypothetical protein Q8A67_003188 [Cirrhinus molitorella]